MGTYLSRTLLVLLACLPTWATAGDAATSARQLVQDMLQGHATEMAQRRDQWLSATEGISLVGASQPIIANTVELQGDGHDLIVKFKVLGELDGNRFVAASKVLEWKLQMTEKQGRWLLVQPNLLRPVVNVATAKRLLADRMAQARDEGDGLLAEQAEKSIAELSK
ncbi:hypothetical protein [Chitinivorax sp. B]|uniref:hypothetical protein n=1 Tax=Chitinivorax sp. B TaxID=2502235 RepID=UPI0010F6D398|nr:hypothetical protein [Chitinivorax sp. B]